MSASLQFRPSRFQFHLTRITNRIVSTAIPKYVQQRRHLVNYPFFTTPFRLTFPSFQTRPSFIRTCLPLAINEYRHTYSCRIAKSQSTHRTVDVSFYHGRIHIVLSMSPQIRNVHSISSCSDDSPRYVDITIEVDRAFRVQHHSTLVLRCATEM